MYLAYLINLRGEKREKKREKEKKKEKKEKRRKREKKEEEERKQFNRGRGRKERRRVFVAWEVLVGQAQGGAYHQRQDMIPEISVGHRHPLRESPMGRSTRYLRGSTAPSMLAAGSGANISRLVASSPDAISQAGDHVASQPLSGSAHQE